MLHLFSLQFYAKGPNALQKQHMTSYIRSINAAINLNDILESDDIVFSK